MGSGIAQAFAQKGYLVVLCDTVPSQLDQAKKSIAKSLNRDVEKHRIDAETRDNILARIQIEKPEALHESDLVIEAVSENYAVKAAVFDGLNRCCKPEAILASNTSSISITRLAAKAKHPEQVIGMHFMNPVPVMKLVELIRGLQTSDETFLRVSHFVTDLDKIPIEVNDAPGFVSNRILMPMINEAVFCVHEGVGTPESVDAVMQLGMNHPMGPLALADLIGLDVCLDIMETLHEGFGDSKYRPCPLLRKMVDAGRLGRKSGWGFYQYPQ